MVKCNAWHVVGAQQTSAEQRKEQRRAGRRSGNFCGTEEGAAVCRTSDVLCARHGDMRFIIHLFICYNCTTWRSFCVPPGRGKEGFCILRDELFRGRDNVWQRVCFLKFHYETLHVSRRNRGSDRRKVCVPVPGFQHLSVLCRIRSI